ncbi:4Fe-4S dicluster domain-containing protein, partial [Citrobacter sp. AAK_AS5]
KRCGACTEVCFFRAVTLTPQGIVRDQALCKGCGRCASVCPTQAIAVRLDNVAAAMDDVLGRIRQRIDFETSA